MSYSLPHLENIVRYKHLDYSRTNYLRLDMNEKPFVLPNHIINSILENMTAEKISTYPEIFSLYDKVSNYYDISKENLLFTNGSESGIRYVFQTYVAPGDNVLTVSPTFAMVPVYSKIFQTP